MKCDLFLGNAALFLVQGYNLNASDRSPEVTISKSLSQFIEGQYQCQSQFMSISMVYKMTF